MGNIAQKTAASTLGMAKIRERNGHCQAPGCEKRPIDSHTFPKAYLTKVAGGESKKLCSLSESSLLNGYGRPFVHTGFKYLTPAQISKTKLFCSDHDTYLFYRIENLREKTDLKTHLFLFGYRLFKQAIIFENTFKDPWNAARSETIANVMQSLGEEKQLVKAAFQLAHEATIKSDRNLDGIEKAFSGIFTKTSAPTAYDFEEHFDIRYYKMPFNAGLLCSGLSFLRPEKPSMRYSPTLSFLAPGPNPDVTYICFITPKDDPTPQLLETLFFRRLDKIDKVATNDSARRLAFNYLLTLIIYSPRQLIMTPSLFEIFKTPVDKLNISGGFWQVQRINTLLRKSNLVTERNDKSLLDLFSTCFEELNNQPIFDAVKRWATNGLIADFAIPNSAPGRSTNTPQRLGPRSTCELICKLDLYNFLEISQK